MVEGVLREKTATLEISAITMDYVPSGSQRKAGLIFSKDPRQFDLQIRAKGYVQPCQRSGVSQRFIGTRFAQFTLSSEFPVRPESFFLTRLLSERSPGRVSAFPRKNRSMY